MKKLLSFFTAILFAATMFACPISASAQGTTGDEMTQGEQQTTTKAPKAKKAKKSKKKSTKKSKKSKKAPKAKKSEPTT